MDSDGCVQYRLRRPWFDGRTEIVLDPIAFLRRLAALIPGPYKNLVRYHGLLRIPDEADSKCAASMTIIAFLTDPVVLTKILGHLKLPSAPPTLAPARSSFDEQELFSDEEIDEPVFRQDPGPGDGSARAPP